MELGGFVYPILCPLSACVARTEEEEEFYKLLPANKADHLCQHTVMMFEQNSYHNGNDAA